jgi:outer membrane receptor protein involved in Fe transport
VLKNRLWIVGGVRFEKTMDKGEGLLRDPNAIFRKDAAENPPMFCSRRIRSSRPNLMFQNRAAHGSKNYDGYYPSLNLTADLTERLVARAGYARTLSRPDYSNIIPGYTITPPAGTDVYGAINVRNTGLRAVARPEHRRLARVLHDRSRRDFRGRIP